jgi:hypothetical protein
VAAINMSTDCLFCGIAAERVMARIIHENDRLLAFLVPALQHSPRSGRLVTDTTTIHALCGKIERRWGNPADDVRNVIQVDV